MKSFLTLISVFIFPFLIYSQIYDDYIGAGHAEGVIVSSSNQETDDQLSISGDGLGRDLAGASRFMSHASLGASLDKLLYVDEIGYEAWIDEQIALPATSYVDVLTPINDIVYDYYIELGGDPEEYFTSTQAFRFAWSHIAQTAPDELRHRISLALSEILVVSTDSDLAVRGFGVASYYDVLANNAFGNYRDLLMEVTLHPVMGFYLSHYNNPASNPSQNIHPDENYAREIMQLFSIGLYELNPDGSRQLDAQGSYIPTYDNDDIKELAKVFTGLSMGDWIIDINLDPAFGFPFFYADPTLPMEMYDDFHETGPKTIIGDYVIEDTSAMEEVELAVDHLFNHPNVGPFIGTLLIKRLVKSNPTSEYVERITNVFNDNGSGVRGDLEAVVKAILLDEEARDCDWIDHPSNGRLKEPIQRYTQYVKALRAESPSGWFWNQGFGFDYLMEQFPMHSPTVFNFFLPDYQPNSQIADENLVAPEFQIFNSSSSVGYFNWIFYMSVADFNNELPEELEVLEVEENYEAHRVIPDLEALSADANAVIDYLDLVMAHGNMTEETRAIIYDSCEPLEVAPEAVIIMALYLTMVSPDFAIMK